MKVGILGATGAVGQKFIRLLENHPWFSIEKLGASERSAGLNYTEACNWIENAPIPGNIATMTVMECRPEFFDDVDFVFSGLDSSVAFEIEGAFARAGIPVISNAKNYRMDPTVPLLIPEINPDHIRLIEQQSFSDDGKGWIVTNPNCVAIPLSLSLKPLHDRYGIDSVVLTTMQAVSGAGYPGVASLDILGNVVPFISGEEPKIGPETRKLLSGLNEKNELEKPEIPLDATATRVPSLNGHMLSVSVRFREKPTSEEQLVDTFLQWENPISGLDLPSSPEQLYRIHPEEKFPQPRIHADQDKGMSLHLGRIRSTEVFDAAFVALAHNTIRGAAGGAILNAELLVRKGYLAGPEN